MYLAWSCSFSSVKMGIGRTTRLGLHCCVLPCCAVIFSFISYINVFYVWYSIVQYSIYSIVQYIYTSYAMLSSGIPWNMPRVTCIFRIHTSL